MYEGTLFIDYPYIFSTGYTYFIRGGALITFWDYFYFWLRIVGWSLAVIFFIIFIFVRKKQVAVAEEEDTKFKTLESEEVMIESPGAEHWQNILALLNSTNPNDWKAAILEADTILDDMVKKMQYKGNNLGERLKTVERSDFETLDQAWEAHKIRNRIAHSSSDFVLTQREANRAIDLYRQVFEEFHYI
jgi:hypothetical protein